MQQHYRNHSLKNLIKNPRNNNFAKTKISNLACFKSYDIRGKVPEEFNADLAYDIGHAYVQIFDPKRVIIGQDIRLESPEIANAVIAGVTDSGADVIDIGVCGTEEVYFHCFDKEKDGVGGGIMVTASHNPMGYNGLKMVGKGSLPIFAERGLNQIKELIINNNFKNSSTKKGNIIIDEDKSRYIEHLLSYINSSDLIPLKIVANPGNGPAGSVVKLLERNLPFEFIYIHEEPDGTFPNGVPNPIIKENQRSTSETVIKHKADFGIAWDGDFDRCFFFDENGQFIEGYYLVGLISEMLLQKTSKQANIKETKKETNKEIIKETIIHDPRLIWNTIDIANSYRANSVQSKTGHSFMKDAMRSKNAIYGGEMSAHHYFRDFAYCDSGMIPWLLVAELLSNRKKEMKMQKTGAQKTREQKEKQDKEQDQGQKQGQKNQPLCTLSDMIEVRRKLYPCSGEINFKVKDAKLIMDRILDHYSTQQTQNDQQIIKIDKTDGVSLEFSDWRFNLRMSNTEPLLRLNIETRNNQQKLEDKITELESIISD